MKKLGLGKGKQNDSFAPNNIDPDQRQKKIRKRSLEVSGQSFVQDPLQVLTFGDWKQIPLKGFIKNSNFQTIQVKDEKKSSQSTRLKQYNDMRLKKVNESERYRPKPLFPTNNTIIRRFCIDPEKKRQSIESLDSSRRQQINYERVSRPKFGKKQIFKILYKRQKERYQALLQKYGIEERIQDDEFQQFCD